MSVGQERFLPLQYQTCGDCQTPRKSYKTSHFVVWVMGWKKASFALDLRRLATIIGSFVSPSELERELKHCSDVIC
jgi:hypothetical protein